MDDSDLEVRQKNAPVQHSGPTIIQQSSESDGFEPSPERKKGKADSDGRNFDQESSEVESSDAHSVESDKQPESRDGEDESGEDESEENESVENESDDDESEDEEPILKYERPAGLLRTVFATDVVSTCIGDESAVIFAMHSGTVHVFEPTTLAEKLSYRAQTASIMDVATDGTYVASASMDGTVAVVSIADEKDRFRADFKRPVHAVALDPNYRSSKSFVSGGMSGKVILSERNWWGNRVDTVLYEGEDVIMSLHWFGTILVWMNQQGITFFSMQSRTTLLKIPRDPSAPRADLYKPRLCMPDANRVYITWANEIWNIKITLSKQKRSALLPSGASVRSLPPQEKVEVESHTQLEWLASGIVPFGRDELMILSVAPRTSNQSVQPPEVKILDAVSGEERYADVVALRGYERLGLNDYHLQRYIGPDSSTKYFVVCATDAVLAVERDLNDHLTWLIDKNNFGEAWDKSVHVLDEYTRLALGLKWVEQLVANENWKDAGVSLAKVLGAVDGIKTRDSEWNRWGDIFADAGHASEIVNRVPNIGTYSDGLNELRTKLLLNLLETDRKLFVDVATHWHYSLFNRKLICEKLEDLSPEENDALELQKVLAKLLVDSGDPISAIPILLDARDDSVVDLIAKYHLLPSVVQYAPRIITVSLASKAGKWYDAPLDVIRVTTQAAVKLFVDGRHQVLPQRVVDVLSDDKSMDVILFLYLEELTRQDSFASNAFGDRLVQLYAEFDRKKLLTFLRKNRNYDISRAIRICEDNSYIEELVYLLGRVGQNKRALKLITEDLGDPVRAIDFASSQSDPDLWKDLINFSMNKPSFVVELLKRVHILDPVDMIKRIPENMEIPGLGETLVTILSEKGIALTISNGVLEVIQEECLRHAKQLRALRLQGRQFDYDVFEEQGLDISQPLVSIPSLEIKTEVGLIGDRAMPHTRAIATKSLANKIRHLAYIIARAE